MYRTRADRWLLYSMSAFSFLTGASIWETVIFVPFWASGNPSRLAILQGNAGIESAHLWVAVHSVFEMIFLVALIFNWKLKNRRAELVIVGVPYAVVRVWTIFYFARSFLEIQRHSAHPEYVSSLIAQTLLWEKLNYVRTALVAALNVPMLVYVNRAILHKESTNSPASLEG
jgi:hypothetical protein